MMQIEVAAPSFPVCYVLTGKDSTRHAEMTWLSIKSLRALHPSVSVVLVVDQSFAQREASAYCSFSDLATMVTAVSEFDDPKLANRDLRTRLCEIVEGRFLYVDGDTLFLRPIADIEFSAAISAVPDFNFDPEGSPPGHGQIISNCLNGIGWGMPPRQFNAGVLLVDDGLDSQDFFARWNRNWRTVLGHSEKCDHFSDQLSFDYTASERSGIVRSAPDSLNTMVATSPSLARTARILHFFSSPAQVSGTLLEHLLTRYRETGEFDAAAVEKCRREGHPWAPNAEAWQYRRSGNFVRAALRKSKSWFAGTNGRSPASGGSQGTTTKQRPTKP